MLKSVDASWNAQAQNRSWNPFLNSKLLPSGDTNNERRLSETLDTGATAKDTRNHRWALENAQPVLAATESGAKHARNHKILVKTGHIFLWDSLSNHLA